MHFSYPLSSILFAFIADAVSPNLNEQDLCSVIKEVYPAKAKWKFIGLNLGVPIGELDSMEGNPGEKLMATLAIWLRRGIDTTWKALADAVGANTVDHNDIKENILTNH